MVKMHPFPKSESSLISPLCNLIILYTIARPRPLPPVSEFLALSAQIKGWNMLSTQSLKQTLRIIYNKIWESVLY